jgi:hypothetical protein
MFEKRRRVGEKRLEKLEVLKEMLVDLNRESSEGVRGCGEAR